MARAPLLMLAAVVWLGFALRVHHLAAVPLRGDEAFSALYWAGLPLSESLGEIAPLDPHPPLAYALFRLWHYAVGTDAPFALRMLPVLGNLIGIAALFRLGWLLSGKRRIGLAAAVLFALHPFEIWHSQDFRNYAIWAGLSALALWLWLRLLADGRAGSWWLYGLAAVGSALLFYTELFVLLALALTALLWRVQIWRRLLCLQAGIFALAIAAFLIFQGDIVFSGAYPGTVEPFAPLDYLTRFVPLLVAGDLAAAGLGGLWLPLTLAVLVCALLIARTRPGIFIAALGGLPLLLLGVAALRVNVFHPRYVLAAVPAFILLLVLGADAAAALLCHRLRVGRTRLMLCLLLPWGILAGAVLDDYYRRSQQDKAPAWDELGGYLNQTVGADDLVIQLSLDPAFAYYYAGAADETALPVSAAQPIEEIAAILQAAQAEYASIFVVANAIPGWQNGDAVENWAQQNMQPVRLTNASGLGIRQYKNWAVDDADGAAVRRFDRAVELVDYAFSPQPLPSGELLLWVYWKPLAQTASALKSFAHLTGAVNPANGTALWSQHDLFPQGGRLDSRDWQLGAVYREVYYLPADGLAAGDYQIIVGWYDPLSGGRLAADDGQDSFALAAFRHP